MVVRCYCGGAGNFADSDEDDKEEEGEEASGAAEEGAAKGDDAPAKEPAASKPAASSDSNAAGEAKITAQVAAPVASEGAPNSSAASTVGVCVLRVRAKTWQKRVLPRAHIPNFPLGPRLACALPAPSQSARSHPRSCHMPPPPSLALRPAAARALAPRRPHGPSSAGAKGEGEEHCEFHASAASSALPSCAWPQPATTPAPATQGGGLRVLSGAASLLILPPPHTHTTPPPPLPLPPRGRLRCSCAM